MFQSETRGLSHLAVQTKNSPKVPPKKPWCLADFDLGLPEFSQAASSLHKPSSLDGRRKTDADRSWVRSWDHAKAYKNPFFWFLLVMKIEDSDKIWDQ